MYNFMVVDDEQLERKAIQVIMERRGLPFKCVAEAGHGAEAVSKAAEQKPDLIFMDIQMPGMNGLEAAKKFLRQTPGAGLYFLQRMTSSSTPGKAYRWELLIIC